MRQANPNGRHEQDDLVWDIVWPEPLPSTSEFQQLIEAMNQEIMRSLAVPVELLHPRSMMVGR